MRKLWILLYLVLCQDAAAGIMLHLGFNYEEEKKEDSGTPANLQTTRQTLNVGCGFVMDTGLFIGLKYFQKNIIADQSSTSGSVTTTTTTKELTTGSGPTLGFYTTNGLVAQASFLLFNPEHEDSTTLYSGGEAQIYDIAYRFSVGEFSFGPQLTFSSFSYRKADTNGIKSDINISESHMLPMLAFWLGF